MFMCVWMAYVRRCPRKPEDSIGCPASKVTDSCECQLNVPWKSSKHSYVRSHLSSAQIKALSLRPETIKLLE